MKALFVFTLVICIIAVVAIGGYFLFQYLIYRKEKMEDAKKKKDTDDILLDIMKPDDWANYDFPQNINV